MLTYLVAQCLHHKYRFMTVKPAAVYQPSGGFIHRDDMFILITDFQ
ncbi:Uncharacterised protein [Klebsiella pneumoniae]|nr:Uncharacterised protein [Klebsiella pneumoniae]